ncbi:MAG TPA: 16S rRNA (adenine(1518)-N(6)/adenine(1519)-N(6))-dimethyltransferase RsmA [Chloroflexota bacterium]|nr:16S rRNA (adenine(1518)-N(6)/adenine(1519)-N(6))-dimethyltransferase RsmA [Chloroflexota bacterium]HUM71335.1 16S rRNA (adenine(1518)-N(6)/adenine(1519)-N(6))-dimethyltransferase RsmA [Chloroflexota bacterium]
MHPKQLLDHYQLEPKKSLGQNFLFDENVLARIVDAAEVGAADEVLEIGPGLGALTRLLAQRARRVVAVELDDRFLPILHNELEELTNVQVVHGDILAQEPGMLFEKPYKVVANVPYYITGAILRHLLAAAHKPELMVLTVQKEVAERLTAVPPHMSLLAVSVQFYGRVQTVTTIKAGAFWPRPDVDSAVVRVELGQARPLPLPEEELFFRIVRAGFSQKRKQLQNNLRQLGLGKEEVAQWLAVAGVDGRRRAETLTLPEWLTLYHTFPAKFTPVT